MIAGNATKLPEVDGSLVPRVWGEDNLLPRMVDGRGFMTGEKAPGGYVLKLDPDGKNCELVSMGYRNAYDLAFNREGDLFTFDSDMEWDMNTPWYRPTRVCMVASGSDFGYRNGAGKWPTYYLDSLPPVVNIGPGSPTGVAFGHGAKFPAKYPGRPATSAIGATASSTPSTSSPKGSAYGAEVEEFITGTPARADRPGRSTPRTAPCTSPSAAGRRPRRSTGSRTHGDESTAPSARPSSTVQSRPRDPADARSLPRQEGPQGRSRPPGPTCPTPIASIRYAARVAIELAQDVADLARQGPGRDRQASPRSNRPARPGPGLRPATRPIATKGGPGSPTARLPGKVIDSLGQLDWENAPVLPEDRRPPGGRGPV